MFRRIQIIAALSLALCGITPAFAATQIKIATVAPDGTAWMREMRATGDAIRKATDDRVELKFYPGGVMGDAATVLRKIKIGQLQGSAFTGGEASLITKDAEIYTIPFLFKSQEEVDQVRAKVDPLVKEAVRKTGFELFEIAPEHPRQAERRRQEAGSLRGKIQPGGVRRAHDRGQPVEGRRGKAKLLDHNVEGAALATRAPEDASACRFPGIQSESRTRFRIRFSRAWRPSAARYSSASAS